MSWKFYDLWLDPLATDNLLASGLPPAAHGPHASLAAVLAEGEGAPKLP